MPRLGPEPAQETRTDGFAYHCPACGCGWSGLVLAHCSRCHLLFGSAAAFTIHMDKAGRCREISALNLLMPVERKMASCQVWVRNGYVQ